MHVNEFIDAGYGRDKYARWMFSHFRLPAVLRLDFDEFMREHKLFCDYGGQTWRCTGASRLGDVWLASDFEQDTGYDRRVDVEDCSNWRAAP